MKKHLSKHYTSFSGEDFLLITEGREPKNSPPPFKYQVRRLVVGVDIFPCGSPIFKISENPEINLAQICKRLNDTKNSRETGPDPGTEDLF